MGRGVFIVIHPSTTGSHARDGQLPSGVAPGCGGPEQGEPAGRGHYRRKHDGSTLPGFRRAGAAGGSIRENEVVEDDRESPDHQDPTDDELSHVSGIGTGACAH